MLDESLGDHPPGREARAQKWNRQDAKNAKRGRNSDENEPRKFLAGTVRQTWLGRGRNPSSLLSPFAYLAVDFQGEFP